MKLKIIDKDFVIFKTENLNNIDFNNEYVFVSKTDEEISIICDKTLLPQNTTVCDYNWKCFKIEGQLDFSLIGILSNILKILADNSISILAVSTYNTDYVFIKKQNILLAKEVLTSQGYTFI